MRRVRESRRRKRKYGKGAVGQASVGAVVLTTGFSVSALPQLACRLREALFRRLPAPSRVVSKRLEDSGQRLGRGSPGILNDTFVLYFLSTAEYLGVYGDRYRFC